MLGTFRYCRVCDLRAVRVVFKSALEQVLVLVSSDGSNLWRRSVLTLPIRDCAYCTLPSREEITVHMPVGRLLRRFGIVRIFPSFVKIPVKEAH